VSIHHLDHLLIYQHILQHISLRHSHIENHCYHDLKINKHILGIELSEKGELYSILQSHPLGFQISLRKKPPSDFNDFFNYRYHMTSIYRGSCRIPILTWNFTHIEIVARLVHIKNNSSVLSKVCSRYKAFKNRMLHIIPMKRAYTVSWKDFVQN
jgi:hypothetical protein